MSGQVRTATVLVTVTFPEGKFLDPAAVVQDILDDRMYGLAADDVAVACELVPAP